VLHNRVESPQPFRTLCLFSAATFTVAVASLAIQQTGLTRLAFGALGLAGILVGLTLASNLNGAAEHVTGSLTATRTVDVGGYRAVAAHPLYARIAGGLFVVAGLGVVAVAMTAPTL
jgi:hypothetical protein